MQFFSLTPITLDLAASDRQIGRRRADSVVVDERDHQETVRMEGLVSKMALHFPRRKNQPIEGAQLLMESIDQVPNHNSPSDEAYGRSTVRGNFQIYYNDTVNDTPNLANAH